MLRVQKNIRNDSCECLQQTHASLKGDVAIVRRTVKTSHFLKVVAMEIDSFPGQERSKSGQ